MTQSVDVLIIGAGAAGLFCAAQAGQRGHSVIVLDHANKAGKKILMSGGGRCNFTNYYIEPQRYLSANPHFCKSALSRYTQWDFIALVDAYAIPYHEKKDGQLFCDNKASDILSMLLSECEKSGAEVCLDTAVERIEKTAAGFRLETSRGPLTCASLVIATGGPSIPTLGATGFGYDIARQFGLDVLPVRAALVPFTITDQNKALCSALSGTSMPVTVECNNKSFSDDLLFTHRGLSGPAMLQISSYWHPGDTLHLNAAPSLDVSEDLSESQLKNPDSLLTTWLAKHYPKRVASTLCELHGWDNKPLKQLNTKDIDNIVDKLTDWQIKPNGTEGYRTAEVTLGGVDTDELSSKTMMSKKVEQLFFIGEVVDVTGWLGGYNFQWAWSSGWAAAQYV